MNQKYKFINQEIKDSKNDINKKFVDFEKFNDYSLDFSGDYGIRNSDIVTDGLRRSYRTGPIIKTEIQKRLKENFKNLFKNINDSGRKIYCVKMNVVTKNKLRAFYSYEVDYVPKNSEKNVIGVLMGVKIILDERLPDFQMSVYIEKSY
jgi:hypothetical protein